MSAGNAIKVQVHLPWSTAGMLAIKSLKKRFMRSVITMISVILAVSFLMSVWVGHNVTTSLCTINDPVVRSLLIRNGVDPNATAIDSKTIWLIALSLLVCSVGIMNAMLMSVTERFREIGTMKCLGATNGFIIRLFMIESGIQGACGTMAGIILGSVVGLLTNAALYGWVVFSALSWFDLLKSGLLSFGTGVVLCTVFAIYPAYVASTMQPVDAMRVEE